MKRSKTTLLIASLLSLGLSVGGAFALVYQGSSKSHTGAIDDAVYLYWGAGSTQATIANVNEMRAGQDNAQYRFFAVEPAFSSNVAGTVTLTYTIAGQEQDSKVYTLDGLLVKVYETTELQTTFDSEKAELKTTLAFDVEADRSKTTTFAVGGENPGKAYYALEFVWDGTEPEGENKAWGGLMTISQDFAA